MPKYISGTSPTKEATALRELPAPETETVEEQRERMRETLKHERKGQRLEEVLSGEEPELMDDEESRKIVSLIDFNPPYVNPKVIEAYQTLMEEGYRIPVLPKPDEVQADESDENPFTSPLRLDYLLDYDTENDPNKVIGNRWMCKGQAFIFVSQSGVGKSSIMAQFSLGWALKRPELTFGIEPIRPLRQMIVQAENDAGDIAEPAKGIAKGFGFSREDVEKASRLVEWHEITGKSGDAFLDDLEAELDKRNNLGEPIDVCWIDPLNNFIGGDISRIQETKPFTERLDRIKKRLGTIFAIIHHTGKPSKDERVMTPTDLAYSMLGSSGLTNWAREVVVLKRESVIEGDPPTFSLTATKRRKKAGMVSLAEEAGGGGEPTDSIYVRHASDGSIRWEQCPAPSTDGSTNPKRRKAGSGKRGRPSSLTSEQLLSIADAVNANGGYPIPVEQLEALARKVGKTPETVRSYLKKADDARKKARAELIEEGAIKAPEDAARAAADQVADLLLECQ